MIKLVLSDLDGTLLNKEMQITEEDRLAIAKLEAKGIGFGLVTGRDIGFCQHLLHTYQLKQCDVIANNGGSLWMDGKKVMEEHMEAKEVLSIMNQLLPHLDSMNPFICNEDRTFYFLKDHYESETKWQEVKHRLSYLGKLSDDDLISHIQASNETAVKISIHTYSQANTDLWLPRLKAMFTEYEVLPTCFDYIEITKKGIDKGSTLQILMDEIKLTRDEVVVIGDGMNDVPMFSYVTHSYAMDSAKDEVIRAARMKTKSVAEVIHSVILYNVEENAVEGDNTNG